jgi:hypothetical protein
MMLRIIHGKLKPGTWDSYERAYKDVMAKAGKIPGLKGTRGIPDPAFPGGPMSGVQSDPPSRSASSYLPTRTASSRTHRVVGDGDLIKSALAMHCIQKPSLDYFVGATTCRP